MLSGITYGTYIIFGLLTSIGAAFIWFFTPETKRLSLEEMVSYLLSSLVSLASILTHGRTLSLDPRERHRQIRKGCWRLIGK
jgi:hypothetical protein